VTNYEIIGIVIAVGVPIIVGLITIIKPIIRLNGSIVKLNMTMERVLDENILVNEKLNKHEDELNDHEKRIYFIEHEKRNK
jgi:hypothetical protein